METILNINQLTKKYGKLLAVNNVSFSIKKGNVYGILGPNGSGKSTTLGMILNVVNKTSGDFEWFDGKLPIHDALKKVGAIIERPNFYPYMSAHQNLKLVCKIKNISYDKIDEKLETVGLLDRKDSAFKTFSLGMKQRLAIASALLNDPEILILDEPTNGLDPQGIHQIRDIIQKIAKNGTTILLASHLLDEVEKVCSDVVILKNGQMIYAGKVENMSDNHVFFELQSVDLEKLKDILQLHPDLLKTNLEQDKLLAYFKTDVQADKLNAFCVSHQIYLSHLSKRKRSLEQQFLSLTESNPA